jgi:hypothetical protein
MGCVVDLRDFGLMPPDQVLRVFFRMFDAETVELGLWKAIGAIAVAGEDKDEGKQIVLDETALLFDQLIALTKAVETLMDDPPKRYPLCRREACISDEAG